MKMNKKGFTLIEMLVVIAIIAVLVSIIIPVVGNSTDKAACATNAANLRGILASAQIAVLQEGLPSEEKTLAVSNGQATYEDETFSAPSAVDCSLVAKGATPTISVATDGTVTVSYPGKTSGTTVTIEDLAAAAGGGTKQAENG